MSSSMNKRVRFGTLKVGQKFAMQSGVSDHINIKVKPARLEPVEENNNVFNGVSLVDGKVRTFSDNTEVFTK